MAGSDAEGAESEEQYKLSEALYGSEERPLTALPLFGGFALYGYSAGHVVGVDVAAEQVALRVPHLPCQSKIFDVAHRGLGEVPAFELSGDAVSDAVSDAVAAFSAAHLDAFVPAVIRGHASHWPAVSRWDFDFFSSSCGSIEVEVTLPRGKRRSQPLAEYLTSLRQPCELEQPYLRGWFYERDAPWLVEDLWQPGDFHELAFVDWFKKLPKRHHPDFHWLFIGAAGSATPLHVDPTLTNAWLTQISGRKRFVLFAPCDLPRLLRRPDEEKPGSFVGLEDALARGVPSFEVVLEPGDTLFVPAFWPHHVDCIDDSVSLTWNFLGEHMFPVVRAAFLANASRAPSDTAE